MDPKDPAQQITDPEPPDDDENLVPDDEIDGNAADAAPVEKEKE